jgi:hypothetical protein
MDTREAFTRRHFNADTTEWLTGQREIVIDEKDWMADGMPWKDAARLAENWVTSLEVLVSAGYMRRDGGDYRSGTFRWNRFAAEVGVRGIGEMGWGVYDTTESGITGARCVEAGSVPMPAARTQAETDEAAAVARKIAAGRLAAARMAAQGHSPRNKTAIPGGVALAQHRAARA